MKIQLNTDHNIQGDDALAAHVEGVVTDALGRFSTQVTRVEVHLSDLNAAKGGSADKQCMMEARLEGRQPMAVTHQADTMRAAITGATGKLQRLLASSLGKLAAPERQARPAAQQDAGQSDGEELADAPYAEPM
ncbi:MULTISPECIES: HPF/RaiA family ribosome-associated protein [unclassified Lysobacter]